MILFVQQKGSHSAGKYHCNFNYLATAVGPDSGTWCEHVLNWNWKWSLSSLLHQRFNTCENQYLVFLFRQAMALFFTEETIEALDANLSICLPLPQFWPERCLSETGACGATVTVSREDCFPAWLLLTHNSFSPSITKWTTVGSTGKVMGCGLDDSCSELCWLTLA